jgi:hypothetical protein
MAQASLTVGHCNFRSIQNTTPRNAMKSTLTRFASVLPARRTSLLALCALLVSPFVITTAHAEDAPAPSRLHALVNFEVSDKYLTPRGMIVQDGGVTFQTLFLAFLNVYDGKPEAFVNNVTLVGGFWNDYATDAVAEHVPAAGSTTTNFIEIDPIFGVSFTLAQDFKLDVTYTAFCMQILDIGTSEHLETKLSYNDTKLLGAFALHPYVSFWKELDNKATAAANFGVPSSYYFEVGIAPGVKLGDIKLEAPMRVLLPADDFYGETFAKSSTVGLYEVGLKASTSLKFMPKGYGFWDGHLGVRYMKFVDKNLQQLATDGGFGSPTKDTAQVYTGVSVFF